MKEQTVFIKVPVSERLPKTEIQHGGDFLSSEVAIITSEGMRSDSYRRTYDLKGGTGKLLSEGWISYGHDITHWLEELPLPETEITAEDILQERIKEYNVEVNDMSKFALTKREVKFFADMMKDYASRMVIQALGRKEEEIELLKLNVKIQKQAHDELYEMVKRKESPSPDRSAGERFISADKLLSSIDNLKYGTKGDERRALLNIEMTVRNMRTQSHPTPSMSIEEAKNMLAKKYNTPWKKITADGVDWENGEVDKFIDEVILLYANQFKR